MEITSKISRPVYFLNIYSVGGGAITPAFSIFIHFEADDQWSSLQSLPYISLNEPTPF